MLLSSVYMLTLFVFNRCELIDFYIPTGHNKDSTHPRLFQWVKDYFKSDKGYKPPLYLQHQGSNIYFYFNYKVII